MAGQLDGKRVLVLGAETDIGRAVTTAVAEAGAKVAAVAATSEAEAAFAVQRLARRLSSGAQKVIAQAIDATNEAALRVMVRQVSKELEGLDAVVYCKRPLPRVVSASQVEEELARDGHVHGLISKFAYKELERSGGGKLVSIAHGAAVSLYVTPVPPLTEPLPVELISIGMQSKRPEAIAAEVIGAIAGEAESG